MGLFSLLAAAAGTYSSNISAVERAGLRSLNEGQTVEYEIESNRGKESAVNLKVK
jgi:cold shock protein